MQTKNGKKDNYLDDTLLIACVEKRSMTRKVTADAYASGYSYSPTQPKLCSSQPHNNTSTSMYTVRVYYIEQTNTLHYSLDNGTHVLYVRRET